MRIDKYLLENQLATSRNKAQYYLAEGVVSVNGKIITKNSYSVAEEDVVLLTSNPCPYVSRGGLKMAKAIEEFKLDLSDRIIIDLGASTGGFTDCALQNGAQKVYAVDVGSDQLAISIKNDPRVVDLGGRNLRTLKPTEFKEPISLIICDVSFISVALVFPVIKTLLDSSGQAIVLIKPQFEAGRHGAKKGVVRLKKQHLAIVLRTLQSAASTGLFLSALTFSPYKGDAGNIEFLACLTPDITKSKMHFDVKQVIDLAHKSL